MSFFGKIFTWWDGATIGTLLYSWRRGKEVGCDSLGNRYFSTTDDKRRWVLYVGPNDASCVPPEWHGWLHGSLADVPAVSLPPRRAWQTEPELNLTGSVAAYRPAGAPENGGLRATASGDYEAWQPHAE